MIESQYQVAPAIVGSTSLGGVNNSMPFPRTGGNYFWLSNGIRIVNFRAENFEEATKRFLDNGVVDIRVWTWDKEDGGPGAVAVICDGRIPDEWFDKRMCFTGMRRPPVEVAQQIYEVMGDPHYEFERFIDPDLYYARQGFVWKPYDDPYGGGGCAKPSSLTPEQLMSELKAKRGGLLSVVHTHEEDGVIYQVEKLHPPVLRGAGARHYRLYSNGQPCVGRQYHYELDTALADIEFMVQRSNHDRVESLQARIVRLERSNRMMNYKLEAGTFEGLRANDVWNEFRELLALKAAGASPQDQEAQQKRIRVMLSELEKNHEQR